MEQTSDEGSHPHSGLTKRIIGAAMRVRTALEARNYPTRIIVNPLVYPSLFSWRLDNEQSASQLVWDKEVMSCICERLSSAGMSLFNGNRYVVKLPAHSTGLPRHVPVNILNKNQKER